MTPHGFPDLEKMAIEYMEGALRFWQSFASSWPLVNNPEIKKLLDDGNIVEAQKLILEELEKQEEL